MKVNQEAFDAGQLAGRLAEGYFAYSAAISLAADPRSSQMYPKTRPGFDVSLGTVKNKDGSEHIFAFGYYLNLASGDPLFVGEMERIWLIGSLLRLGDVLARNRYFDRAPELELVRHLRNGIAHGNRFRIESFVNLSKFPAHDRDAWVRNPNSIFEITPYLQGKIVLFDFVAPGDVVSILQAVSTYLVRMGNGDPLRP